MPVDASAMTNEVPSNYQYKYKTAATTSELTKTATGTITVTVPAAVGTTTAVTTPTVTTTSLTATVVTSTTTVTYANKLPYYNTIYSRILENMPYQSTSASTVTSNIITSVAATTKTTISSTASSFSSASFSANNNINNTVLSDYDLAEYLGAKQKSYNSLGGYVSHTALFGLSSASLTSGNNLNEASANTSTLTSRINTVNNNITSPNFPILNNDTNCFNLPSTAVLKSIIRNTSGSSKPNIIPLASSSGVSKILTKTATHDPRLNPKLTAPVPAPVPKRKLSINEYRKRMVGSSGSNKAECTYESSRQSETVAVLPLTNTTSTAAIKASASRDLTSTTTLSNIPISSSLSSLNFSVKPSVNLDIAKDECDVASVVKSLSKDIEPSCQLRSNIDEDLKLSIDKQIQSELQLKSMSSTISSLNDSLLTLGKEKQFRTQEILTNVEEDATLKGNFINSLLS